MLYRLLVLLLAVSTDALRLQTPISRRQAAASVASSVVGLALAPLPASAKMLKKPPPDSAANAKAYRLSKPKYGVDEGSADFLANARRREDFEAGVKPRDANITPIRDPVTGEDLSKRRTYAAAVAAGDDLCATPGACGRRRDLSKK